MAYDEGLAQRIRELIVDELDVTEKRMFGGLAFLVNGHMSVAVSSKGGLMARADPEDAERLVLGDGVEPFEMRGKALRGWLRVDGSRLTEDDELRGWVDRGLDVARGLPPKE
ncbi:TfoX/Sxy family protein [Luteipulveratus sp. YIM 133132]|uniref:TfoX/Sxy family protein n=1 Tax=Luteipulveratus flavus TaxID=3031728 RepID=UPI0023B19718|nr:TfoX/Sxy family protein [Luteipulveratus sp. YIM 133132]MDE9364231.1 TfoX/Sxy family protein [Luteipulveratus sp. YIM 133132]